MPTKAPNTAPPPPATAPPMAAQTTRQIIPIRHPLSELEEDEFEDGELEDDE